MMGTWSIILIGFAIFEIVMLILGVYEMNHAYDVDSNDETFLE